MKAVVLGASGQVGYELIKRGKDRPHQLIGLTHQDIDISDPAAIKKMMLSHSPDAVINAAAYTAVDQAEQERDTAFKINAEAAGFLAEVCAATGCPLIHISTDYVFDGRQDQPYRENDQVNPLNVYGASKEDGEARIRTKLDQHIILRTSWVFSARRQNFVKTILRLLQAGKPLSVINDQIGCPTAAREIAGAILDILESLEANPKYGTYHYCGDIAVSWYQFALKIAEVAGVDNPGIKAVTTEQYGQPILRPLNSILDCRLILNDYGIRQPDWQKNLAGVIAQLIKEEQ